MSRNGVKTPLLSGEDVVIRAGVPSEMSAEMEKVRHFVTLRPPSPFCATLRQHSAPP